ncbi:hypothetical protein CHU00_17540 [Sphingobacterium cellulitidis]|uniref:hypothetical protein n=1 Tax=Sphingobacterium cellulitidis TaxID=1768011 RepID=UPI000B93EB23|nr:hypothetical protein [Sphingobacterium cellulitidis]OYD44312.1 hypothetical protein CHU00_17540 [Sphingobacterium cellulitidis]
MANPGFDKRPVQGKIPANFDVLAKTARVNGCLIYHKPSKKWFTPEEFEDWPMEISQTRTFRKDNAADFMIVQPQFVLKQRIEWVNKANEELQKIVKVMKL